MKKKNLVGGEAKLLELTQFSVKRIYGVRWKKPRIDRDELARLFWDLGLTMKEIAARLGIGRTTVLENLRKAGFSASKENAQVD